MTGSRTQGATLQHATLQQALSDVPPDVWRTIALAALAAEGNSVSAWLRLSMVSSAWRKVLAGTGSLLAFAFHVGLRLCTFLRPARRRVPQSRALNIHTNQTFIAGCCSGCRCAGGDRARRADVPPAAAVAAHHARPRATGGLPRRRRGIRIAASQPVNSGVYPGCTALMTPYLIKSGSCSWIPVSITIMQRRVWVREQHSAPARPVYVRKGCVCAILVAAAS